MNKLIIPRYDQLEFFITIHTNVKTKKIEEIQQVNRAIKNYFQKSFPHRKQPYFLLIINERYPEGELKDFFHLHILLGQLSNELYNNSRRVKEFSVKYPFPRNLKDTIKHKQYFLDEFFCSMKFKKKSLIEKIEKNNFYGLTNSSKALKIVPARDATDDLYKYLEKTADLEGIDLLDTMNSLFIKT